MSEALRAALYGFMQQHNVLTLAYQDEEGVGSCALWFAPDEALACYFLSALTTRHGRALAAGGEVAFTIQKDEQPWQAIRGVQGRGRCAPLTEPLRSTAWQVYQSRFPFISQQFPDLESALQRSLLWQIVPAWLRLIDNSRGFGFKEELWLT
ncbi:MAG: pyridoxamine 5'-phosphate oxidase family protein [Ardenticatenales bacterium]|nr:pyridoxamine 5'-phosphate oxidase family protein [Ardenticatenales bacterium]